MIYHTWLDTKFKIYALIYYKQCIAMYLWSILGIRQLGCYVEDKPLHHINLFITNFYL